MKVKSMLLTVTLILCVIVNVYLFGHLVKRVSHLRPKSKTYQWVYDLFSNNVCYLGVLLGGFLFFKFLQKANVHLNENSFLRMFFFEPVSPYRHTDSSIGDNDDSKTKLLISPPETENSNAMSFQKETLCFCFCFVGLQVTYLSWGVVQEKIMTKQYSSPHQNNGTSVQFSNSQFLVFVNRILSFVLSAIYLQLTTHQRHCCPIFKYMFCSMSNILSSWCQYEALKYVSFISQVLAKSCKIIPVMLMGKLVMKLKYKRYEYLTAILISTGIMLFMLSSTKTSTNSLETTLSGVILLIMYLMADSFTSNWQNSLFKSYQMTSMQMMCGVNFFSSILTLISLLQQDQFFDAIDFMIDYPHFFLDCCILSICSTFGQFFIFYTINIFGAVAFTIMMTVRQGLSILLSCLIYNHTIGPFGFLGICLVFISLFLRVYFNYRRMKQIQRKQNLKNEV